jgi:single-strand DNA-binding protein
MNNINLVGRITKDLESKIAGNTVICNFSIAVNRRFAKEGQQKADFINCVCFGKVAENLCKYQGKGSLIGINGTLNIDQYQKDGENKTFTKVVANEIEFLGGNGEKKEANEFESMDISEDDIPF